MMFDVCGLIGGVQPRGLRVTASHVHVGKYIVVQRGEGVGGRGDMQLRGHKGDNTKGETPGGRWGSFPAVLVELQYRVRRAGGLGGWAQSRSRSRSRS